jgi:hypothetical protein
MNALSLPFVKAPMRHLAFAVALVSIVTLGAAPARAADETERITRTVKLDPGGTLRLKSFSGRVTITAADRHDVAIDAVRRAPRERLDSIKLDIHSEGSGTLVVDANHKERSWYEFSSHNNVVETDFDIKVPRHTNLDISVFSAPVVIDGVEGSHKVHTFSSRLRLDDVAGSIEAHSFSGPIDIREKSWQANQTIVADTFSGSIDVRVPESAQANVTFNSFCGHLNSDLPLTLNSTSRRAMKARLGSGGADSGEWRFKTFSGDVKINR